MKLFIIFMVFCSIAYYYRFFRMKEDVKNDPIKTLLDKSINVQLGLFCVTFSFLITDTAIGFIITTLAVFFYIFTLGMAYSGYSSPKYNRVFIYCLVLCILLLLLSLRFILIRNSTILFMVWPYAMLLYGKFFFENSKIKSVYRYPVLVFGFLLVLSAFHFFPEFWIPPQERVAKDFINNTFHGELIYIYYDKNLRGEISKITASYSTGVNNIDCHVMLVYKNAQIISYESHDY